MSKKGLKERFDETFEKYMDVFWIEKYKSSRRRFKEELEELFNQALQEKEKKTITRFKILLGRMRACEEEHPDTHRVSLKEIPSWIEELTK